ncbi:MAG: hypothetical protein TREMPRED_001672 [Tremellales sp. Tagirdzhanova-0007]|nr:MAG: hypothetical protein TREMPRED_001672 [Tremellales sp. Tagirdzhanova-0007]
MASPNLRVPLASSAVFSRWDSPRTKAGVHSVIVLDRSKMKQEPYLDHQPFGQMPYLVDGDTGLEVYESRAISKYVAAKIKSPLFPTTQDLSAYSAFETACDFEHSDFDTYAFGIWFEVVFKKMKQLETDQAILASHKATLAKKLEGYERVLGKSRFVAGDNLTLADLFHLPYGQKALDVGGVPGLTDGTLPNVTRWWKEISALKSWTDRDQLLGASV